MADDNYTTVAEFAYDALGRRIKKVDSKASETTLYYHNNNCVLSVGLYDTIFRDCYHARSQKQYLMRTSHEKAVEIEVARKLHPPCPLAGLQQSMQEWAGVGGEEEGELLTSLSPDQLNWFKARKQFSAGAVEGLNRKVNLVTRKSYGFRSFEVLKVALYHTLGHLPEPEVASGPQILLKRPIFLL